MNDLKNAHANDATKNRDMIKRSTWAACFCCERIFAAADVVEFVENRLGDDTAICPRCGIDSVLGDAGTAPFTPRFINRMNRYWFQGAVPLRYA